MSMVVIKDPPYMKRQKMKIDYWGLSFLSVGLGSLQFVLDKGEREDWFESNLIVFFAVVAAVTLVLLLINELYDKHPIVDLRLFKDMTFTSGCIVMFFVYLNLFGSIVLLPMFLQSLMGYTSYYAGLVLGPGGIATMLIMPIAGRMVNRINPKGILFVGIAICSLSTYMMSLFNMQTDFWTFVWPRVLMGIGMGLTFIPLTTMTLSHIPKEEMTEASSLYNLIRNIGGSVGVAFTTTILARRAQFHQTRLVEHLSPFDRTYAFYHSNIAAFLGAQGLQSNSADGLMYHELISQSMALAFNDAFLIICILMLCVLPLVFMMKKPEAQERHQTTAIET